MAVPEVPDPPFPTGAPYWYWLGGRPALDFVNTLRERWRRRVECLVTPQDLGAWLAQARLLAPGEPVSPDLLPAARALREAIDVAARAVVDGAPVPAPALAAIDGWLAHAATRPVLAPGPGGAPALREVPAADPVSHALGLLALDAARMLALPAERERVRICASGTCSARFYDRSPAGRRRWCSMAACGNAAKARRHRARAGGATTS
jgi:predicted RNA-binding Zn ribbon-like protein